jgi:hypothetical protein
VQLELLIADVTTHISLCPLFAITQLNLFPKMGNPTYLTGDFREV